MKNTIIKSLFLAFTLLMIQGCSRADENADVLAQEEVSSVILAVEEQGTGVVQSYTYVANAAHYPHLHLETGKIYDVQVIFRNGSEDITQEIIEERDEHFLIYDFKNAEISLVRTDAEIRNDGKRLGIAVQWTVNQIATTDARLELTLYHDPVTVDEGQNGTAWGSVTGGETDAVAFFDITD
ncbi:hypothetical protein [Chryseobacterium sp. MFBS3-17]|uniref:hypothetical protein n=1 Tax=Chryseobacterium sp. MFBS3-17 TaxID=2886689 RepID=UPI001D0F02C4|nr:hypothetical protein [Chryseobacterium sp. MFBS3-17]MCC2591100.1 hypothetical protein [Chryseobacterium sp. MFBS3-17]